MRTRTILISFLLFGGTCLAQNLHPNKDLAFGQIAAGGGYESVLTVTNRGTDTYSGTLELYTTADGLPWNPTINGVQVSGGTQDISLSPGETKTYRMTQSGNTESAFGVVKSADMLQSSYIEGNLTYFVSAEGDTTPFEGVGVPPSSEFYKTTIPFEDALTVALAMANINTESANVNLTVFSESNVQEGTNAIEIGPNGHSVSFLWDQITGLSGAGRLEIESDKPIFGTALSFVSSSASPVGMLFSSLPLLPSPYSYTFAMDLAGVPIEGELGFYAQGPFLNGYLVLTNAMSTPIEPPESHVFFGQLQNGSLQGGGYGSSAFVGGGQPLGYLITIENFDFAATTVSGTLYMDDPAGGPRLQIPTTMTKKF